MKFSNNGVAGARQIDRTRVGYGNTVSTNLQSLVIIGFQAKEGCTNWDRDGELPGISIRPGGLIGKVVDFN